MSGRKSTRGGSKPFVRHDKHTILDNESLVIRYEVGVSYNWWFDREQQAFLWGTRVHRSVDGEGTSQRHHAWAGKYKGMSAGIVEAIIELIRKASSNALPGSREAVHWEYVKQRRDHLSTLRPPPVGKRFNKPPHATTHASQPTAPGSDAATLQDTNTNRPQPQSQFQSQFQSQYLAPPPGPVQSQYPAPPPGPVQSRYPAQTQRGPYVSPYEPIQQPGYAAAAPLQLTVPNPHPHQYGASYGVAHPTPQQAAPISTRPQPHPHSGFLDLAPPGQPSSENSQYPEVPNVPPEVQKMLDRLRWQGPDFDLYFDAPNKQKNFNANQQAVLYNLIQYKMVEERDVIEAHNRWSNKYPGLLPSLAKAVVIKITQLNKEAPPGSRSAAHCQFVTQIRNNWSDLPPPRKNFSTGKKKDFQMEQAQLLQSQGPQPQESAQTASPSLSDYERDPRIAEKYPQFQAANWLTPEQLKSRAQGGYSNTLQVRAPSPRHYPGGTSNLKPLPSAGRSRTPQPTASPGAQRSSSSEYSDYSNDSHHPSDDPDRIVPQRMRRHPHVDPSGYVERERSVLTSREHPPSWHRDSPRSRRSDSPRAAPSPDYHTRTPPKRDSPYDKSPNPPDLTPEERKRRRKFDEAMADLWMEALGDLPMEAFEQIPKERRERRERKAKPLVEENERMTKLYDQQQAEAKILAEREQRYEQEGHTPSRRDDRPPRRRPESPKKGRRRH